MPADPTPDLATLDALLAAATPGPFYVVEDPEYPSLRAVYVGGPDGDLWASALLPEDAEAFAAAVNALPALLREVRIGRAAREVLADLLLRGLDHDNYVLVHRPDWQRARALLESPDA